MIERGHLTATSPLFFIKKMNFNEKEKKMIKECIFLIKKFIFLMKRGGEGQLNVPSVSFLTYFLFISFSNLLLDLYKFNNGFEILLYGDS